jgi:hypothetical protein
MRVWLRRLWREMNNVDRQVGQARVKRWVKGVWEWANEGKVELGSWM